MAERLAELAAHYGPWIYGILFTVVFCETGLVVTPFLPGDSLLFAAGALAATGAIKVMPLYLLLLAAAFLGDNINYMIGRIVGLKVFKENARVLKKEYLDKTHKFYERYGGRTIILAQFAPLFRTFVPFVAGAGQMDYPKFLKYNVIGVFVWVTSFIWGGFYFGNLPFVKKNFTLVVGAIIIISFLPAVIEVIRHRMRNKADNISGGKR